MSGERGSRNWLDISHATNPVVLSTNQFPLQPPSSSASLPTDSSPKYRHVLGSQSINPQMDLVAILSRDVGATASNASSGGVGGAMHASSVLAPPPPGMSAAANQARMRMMMMARARALAAGGSLPSNSSTPAETPKVTRSASLRLSLWRMASTAGEQGSRVWDVDVRVPDLFDDAGKDIKELEDVDVSAMAWSPNGQHLALTVQITRRRAESTTHCRQHQFLLIYGLQDGKQHRTIRIPTSGSSLPSQALHGLEWRKLAADGRRKAVPGSADDLLKRMPDLCDISALSEEGNGKSKQRQRGLITMRNTSQKQGDVDRKAEEVMQLDSSDWAKALLDHPRTLTLQREERDGEQVLCAWDSHRIHLFLDASLYLGSIAGEEAIVASNVVSHDGSLALCTQRQGRQALSFQSIPTQLHARYPRFSSALQLQSLSSHAFGLLTYCYDSLVQTRNLYRSTHINCITPWIQRGKSVNRKYSTEFQSEMQMLLLTTYANEAITAVLAGNDAMTEGDLTKMKAELDSVWTRLETLVEGMLQSLQRAAIVFEELKGCFLWTERFGTFLSTEQGKTIDGILKLVFASQQRCLTLLRRVQQEARCWTHFYRWWKYERVRQEAIRDQVIEPKTDVSYDVLLLATFLTRGFVDYALERILGIVLDKKTRGTYVDDDEDEEEEDTRGDGDQEGEEEEDTTVAEEPNGIEHHEASLHNADWLNTGEGEDSKKPWHSRPALQHHLASVERELQEMPGEHNGDDDGQAPSAEDIRRLASSDFILTGPAKGLAKRPREKEPRADLLSDIKAMTQLSSALFSQALARYAPQEQALRRVDHPLRFPPLPLRPDGLQSNAGEKKDEDESQGRRLARSRLDDATGQQRLLLIDQDEEGKGSMVVVEHDCRHGRVQEAAIEWAGRIIDVGFYSDTEVVGLTQGEGAGSPGEVIRMASFRLDRLAFAPSSASAGAVQPSRCYEMHQRGPGNLATQLALNQVKDVAATLDSQGRLFYWDLVLLAHEEDRDEEMG